jgi:CHAT domain-containing protein
MMDEDAWNTAERSIRAAVRGGILMERFEQTSDPTLLAQAITIFDEAVAAAAPDEAGRKWHLIHLGNALRARYLLDGNVEDLRRAVVSYEEALAASAPDDPDHAEMLGSLANGLRLRYLRSGEMADLDRAVALYQQAVDLTGESSRRPDHLANLATGLMDRYERTGNGDDLSAAVDSLREAVVATPVGHEARPLYLNSLGLALIHRHEYSGQLADLDEAAESLRLSVQATPPGSVDHGRNMSSLATALRYRFERSRNRQDLELALAADYEAVRSTPAASSLRADVLGNLVLSLLDRFDLTGDESNLNLAAYKAVEALQMMPQGAPGRASRLTNLGIVLLKKYRRSAAAADLDSAIAAAWQAVAETPQAAPVRSLRLHNLGNMLREQADKDGTTPSLLTAVQAYREAGREGLGLNPLAALSSARAWSSWAERRDSWYEAAEACRYGLDALDGLVRRQLLREHKEDWLSEAEELPARAAYALARTSAAEEALLVLERGRMLVLSDGLARHRADLEQLPARGRDDLLIRFRAAAERLDRLDRRELDTGTSVHQWDLASERRAAQAELDAAVAEIRTLPGLHGLLEPPVLTDVIEAAGDAALAYLAAVPAGGMALIAVPASEPLVSPLWLPRLTSTALYDRVRALLKAYDDRARGPVAWWAALDGLTRWLWDAAIGPLLDAVSLHACLTIVPTGLLGLLPLHAAWTEDDRLPTGRRYALDVATITYAPNARALRESRRRLATGDPPRGVLVVAEPLRADVDPLPDVTVETAAALAALPPGNVLAGADATAKAVLNRLSGPAVLHFACHGLVQAASPLDSCLLLAGSDRLTVRDILRYATAGQRSMARLVVLSACETNFPGLKLPDEVTSLPAGWLAADAGGVIGSLWSVGDSATSLLLARFYHNWQDEVSPQEALRQAQRWIRDATNQEKHRFAPTVAAFAPPDGTAAARRLWETARMHTHPLFWAAFSFHGAWPGESLRDRPGNR